MPQINIFALINKYITNLFIAVDNDAGFDINIFQLRCTFNGLMKDSILL